MSSPHDISLCFHRNSSSFVVYRSIKNHCFYYETFLLLSIVCHIKNRVFFYFLYILGYNMHFSFTNQIICSLNTSELFRTFTFHVQIFDLLNSFCSCSCLVSLQVFVIPRAKYISLHFSFKCNQSFCYILRSVIWSHSRM